MPTGGIFRRLKPYLSYYWKDPVCPGGEPCPTPPTFSASKT